MQSCALFDKYRDEELDDSGRGEFECRCSTISLVS
jgi:hypothetical protein